MICRGMKIGKTGGWLVEYVYVIATIVISLPVFPIVSLIIGKRRIGQNIHKSEPITGEIPPIELKLLEIFQDLTKCANTLLALYL